ncbi:hypothetical protein MASR1M32_39140 [Rhodobacter sp.]
MKALLKPEAEHRRAERRERDARRGRLGRGRFDNLVKGLVAVIRLAFEEKKIGSLFGLEGPLRHAIRSDLCLQGWTWRDADQMAREMLDETFRALRATRPTWNEGQLEWTIPTNILIERSNCIRCHKPLPEGHHKFCSRLCATGHHRALSYLKSRSEVQAMDLAVRRI